ncbi:Rgp1-domain-containing protein [Boletus edulis BED1]|uniref:Rgp1-domain-containing protein n=1 Tax=Boletus edulis BED1 TaxID=1328754 RepID=A0AAD4C249_BOLED|nr:Rgp1-domain-containing protein [Boletus edulis BED1]
MSTDDPTAADVDPAIRVHVSPSQASYFTGEQFSVTITFTNTRTPESPKVKNSHRRGVHSISSAPLARPPTSPGVPRPTALTPPASAPVNNARDMPTRKRLIGKTDMSMVLEQKRQSLLERSRSLSIDIPTTDLPPKAADNANLSASRYVRAYSEFSDSGACVQSYPPILLTPRQGLPPTKSPLTRSPDFPLPPHHPHARKQSVADVHFHLNEVQQSSPTPPPPAMVSSSGSTFSLALDPIAETPTSPYPGTPFASSPSLTESLDQHSLKTAPHGYPPRPPPAHRPSQLGLGHGPPPPNPQSKPTPPLRNGTLVGSNSELILYSYAQLLGTVSITPLSGVAVSPDQAQTLAALRLKLLKRTVVGGGSMDITSHQRIQDRRRSHNRSASLTSSFLSLLSPSTYSAPSTPLPSSQSWAPGRSRTPSVSSVSSATPAGGQQNGVGLGLINGGTEEDVDPDVPLPTFDVQPAMLTVDLMLGPGESRTYTYTVALPDNLPPTFRGRALKFSYELVIGTCRANPSATRTTSSLGPTGANSISRVMKVPIRVYNHVAVGKVPRPYDLLWPMGKRVLTMETAPKVMDGPLKGVTQVVSPCKDSSRSLEDLRDYGRRLLATFSDPDATDIGRIKMPLEAISPAQSEFEREREGDGGALTGCREAVEILTRNPKKVSYDVNKDGVKVAVLTFTKSAYRLGETVLGVVELNERQSRSRVLSLSAMLESQETLPSQIASAGNLRHMRRVHAEHHASLVSSVLRTTFSLDIPSDASPAFQVQLSETGHSAIAGGLLWRVRLSLLVAVAAETSQMSADGVWLKQLAPDGPAGGWGTPYKAYPSIAPKERPQRDDEAEPSVPWAQYFVSSFLGTAEREYHDGDEAEDEDETKAMRVEEDEWKEMAVETVECEVAINVWPGNTLFKAMDVVFDV